MKSQILQTVDCDISGEAAVEIWNWSLLGMKGFKISGGAQGEVKLFSTTITSYPHKVDMVVVKFRGRLAAWQIAWQVAVLGLFKKYPEMVRAGTVLTYW